MKANIEKGCTAIVIGIVPENIGKVVTVGNYIGKIERYRSDMWEVDQLMVFTGGPAEHFASERTLHRINDDGYDKVDELNKEVCIGLEGE